MYPSIIKDKAFAYSIRIPHDQPSKQCGIMSGADGHVCQCGQCPRWNMHVT